MILSIGTLGTPLDLWFLHRCDKYAAAGDVKKFEREYWLTGFIPKLIFVPITPLAFYFGSDAVVSLINMLPKFIIDGIGIAGGLLPALGFLRC